MFELIKFVWFLQSGVKESDESEVWEQEESGSEWPCCDGGHVEAGKSGFILLCKNRTTKWLLKAN